MMINKQYYNLHVREFHMQDKTKKDVLCGKP